MISPRLLLAASLLLTGVGSNGISQDAKPSPRLVEDLLTLPAPPRPWTEVEIGGGRENPPPNDAPSSVVLGYWADMVTYEHIKKGRRAPPAPETLEVLLRGCEAGSVHHYRLIELFPLTLPLESRPLER